MYPINRTLDCPKYEQLVSKKKCKSLVWKYFGQPADIKGQLVAQNIAVCKTCKYPVSAKGGSTTNLMTHLKIYHPLTFSDVTSSNKQLQNASPSFVDNISQSSTSSSKNEFIDVDDAPVPPAKKQRTLHEFQPLGGNCLKKYNDAVSKFIVETLQPFSVVESQSFKNMVHILNPRYKVPCRKYFSTTAIPRLFENVVDTIKRHLLAIDSNNVSITTDCWTSLSNIPYIAITVHFINSQWELQSACLTCKPFNEDHTSQNIAEAMTSILSDWDLDIANITSCTTDNGRNILKAVSLLEIPHVPCFGHTINIGVNKALEIPSIKKAVSRVRKLQNALAHSWKMVRDFRKAQELMQMNVVSLPSACITRWWSILKLCKRFLENQLPIRKLLQDYPSKKHLMADSNEVNTLEEIVNATKLLEEISKNLSGEGYTTASSILPLLRKVNKSLRELPSDNSMQKQIKSELLSSLIRYEKPELMSLLRLSSFCDPRFRLNFIDEPEQTKMIVLEKMIALYEIEDAQSVATVENPKVLEDTKKGLEKLLESDEDDDTLNVNILTPSCKAEREFNNFISMPKVGLNDDPLKWWKMNEHNFPTLKLLARKYLTVQGSSVPSERVFSTGGNVVRKNRASLSPKHSEMLNIISNIAQS
nr:E3 SUMO-protein ligase ZBED1-like [Parasteatoda tepidariorum]